MPRYYRRRYTRTVAAPKKKWASNIIVLQKQELSSPYVIDLVKNSAQTSNPTPTILKVGNFKISFDMYAQYDSTTIESVVANCFVMFVPEGIQNSAIPSLVQQHPEYVMAAKVCGGSFGSGTVLDLETLNMSTRLKRNLNSGDRVVLMLAFAGSITPSAMYASGTARYWCCAN